MKEANVLDLDGKDNSMIPTVSNGSLFFAPLLREPLIAACVIYWQAREITRLLKKHDPEAKKFNPELITHISPIGWDNVILYGQYKLDPRLIR